MVESAANVFLETLRDLLVEETKFLLSVRSEVGQVKTDLRRMHALLMKADRERNDSPTIKEYVLELRDFAFKAETMLETYAVEVESKKEGKTLKEKLRRYICIMSECYQVDQIGRDTQKILSGLADLTQKLESELGQESSSHHQQQHLLLRQTYAHEVEPHFVGMEKDIENIVSMVKDEKRTQRVVKIYGMGGLGKTTLARKIYNHVDVQSYTRVWVCITQQLQPKAVLGNILKQLDSNNADIDKMDVDDLVIRIHNFLQHRKCLIVIDDIWENDHWEIIKPAFPMKCNVLLTTRNENIATPQSQPYKLELLTEDEGWELLQKIALPQNFGPVETNVQSLEALGREIVVKCGRLPLAISVIGGILHKKEEAEWKTVSEKLDSYLRHGEGVTEYKRVKQVLDLSYDALPYYLKPCFLYLACFKEDANIDTERLYRFWMAEGFICHQDKGREETLRDVAERYLTELAMRCMVQASKDENNYTSRGKFDSCRLHDLMHDLCSSKAEEEKLVKRIDPSRYQNDIPPSISRLAITFDENMDLRGMAGLHELSRLRSFMVLQEEYLLTNSIRFEDSGISFDKSECLRILELNGCEFERDELGNKLCKLIHLRYLSLMDSVVRELPEFVCGMPYLQTLDLRVLSVFSVIIRVPNVIWKMKRLRHLFLPYEMEVVAGEKLILEGLNELETLHEIKSETACIADIPKLMSLVELYIFVNSDMDSMKTLADHMSNKTGCRLRETDVRVSSCDFNSENGSDVLKNLLMSPSLVRLMLVGCNMSGGFPEYEQGMSQNLLSLDLCRSDVKGDLMEKLGKYPMLQRFTLSDRKFGMEEALIFPSNSFPRLKFLTLSCLPSLKRLEVDKRALPKLSTLEINYCNNLEKLPDGLRFISTLQELSIGNMPDEFKKRARGKDHATISHIPTVKWY